MTLTLSQSATAVAANAPASFVGLNGTAPYAYAVLPGGAGGTINATTGRYTAPATAQSNPKFAFDTVQVTDDDGATATAKILVGTPLLLFCEILQRELGLSDGRVYLWDQKITQPSDAGLYVAVSVLTCRPFANVSRFTATGEVEAYVSMLATVDIDIISRGPDARDRKEEILLALGSVYSQQQQSANSFYVAKLPAGSRFINLSSSDGAAIPYRYKISMNMQYEYSKTKAVPYFDDFSAATVTTDS